MSESIELEGFEVFPGAAQCLGKGFKIRPEDGSFIVCLGGLWGVAEGSGLNYGKSEKYLWNRIKRMARKKELFVYSARLLKSRQDMGGDTIGGIILEVMKEQTEKGPAVLARIHPVDQEEGKMMVAAMNMRANEMYYSFLCEARPDSEDITNFLGFAYD